MSYLIWFAAIFGYFILTTYFVIRLSKGSIYNNKKLYRGRAIVYALFYMPILCICAWALATGQQGSIGLLVFCCIAASAIYAYEQYIFQPKLNTLIDNANTLYESLKHEHEKEAYQFDPQKDTLLLNRDEGMYIRGHIVDLRLDRLGKNRFGEYFWVQSSVNGSCETKIKHLDNGAAKNLLRPNRELYREEFDEDPYFISQ